MHWNCWTKHKHTRDLVNRMRRRIRKRKWEGVIGVWLFLGVDIHWCVYDVLCACDRRQNRSVVCSHMATTQSPHNSHFNTHQLTPLWPSPVNLNFPIVITTTQPLHPLPLQFTHTPNTSTQDTSSSIHPRHPYTHLMHPTSSTHPLLPFLPPTLCIDLYLEVWNKELWSAIFLL